MDTFGGGKVLLCLLVCLAVSLASSSGLPKSGYDYKTASASSGGLNTILKAVLVHESTGHGLHGGSISGQNDGQRVTVTKQGAHRAQPTADAGYSYAGGQQMQRQHQQRETKNIRVFHKSLGATGNIRPPGLSSPQVQVVKVIREYPPQQRQVSFNAIKREFSVTAADQPSQSLSYIHETALARPSFFLPTVVPPEGAKSGYNYANGQQSPPSGYQYSQPSNQQSSPSGYQYSQPSNQQSPSNGYQYSQPSNQQSPASGYQYSQPSNQQSPPSGYQYSQPSNQGLQFSPNQASTGSSGYQYQNPGQSLEASNFQTPSDYRQPVQSAAPQMTLHPGFRLENPRPQGYSYQSPAPIQPGDTEQIAISHYVSSAVQPAKQGYRYDNPQQAANDVPQFIEPSNSEGYRYSNPEPQERLPSLSQAAQGNGPSDAENVGYHYDRPEKSFDYYKPAVTKSTFKGQSYLPLPSVSSGKGYDNPQPAQSDGYTYDRPNPSERPGMVFKGPSYLPLPPASGSW